MAEQSARNDKGSTNSPPLKKRERWLKWLAVGIVAVTLVLFIGGPMVGRRLIRSRLQQMIASKLNAELRIGSLSYRFPFGVNVENAELVTTGPEGQALELLKLPKLRIELARLPFRSGPLVISRIILTEPSVHLIKPKSASGDASPPPQSNSAIERPFTANKLSEMFELRQVAIKGGQIVYEDRSKPETVPFVWRDVNMDLGTDPARNPTYDFNLTADNGNLASLQMAGNFDIDAFTAAIEKLKMDLKVDPDDKQSPAPANIQQIIIENKISGALTIEGTARLSAKDVDSSQFDVMISLASARGKLPGLDDEVEIGGGINRAVARVHLTSTASRPEQQLLATALKMRAQSAIPIYVTIDDFEARGGGHVVIMKHAEAAIDARSPSWELQEAKARVIFGGENVNRQSALLKQAGLMGAVDLRISGGGAAKGKQIREADYRLSVHAESANLSAMDRRVTLTNLKSDFALSPKMVEIVDDGKSNHGFNANIYGGAIYVKGAIQHVDPIRYSAVVKVSGVDLQQIGNSIKKADGTPVTLTGRGSLNAQIYSKPAQPGQSILDQLNGNGEFEVVDGRFYEIPMISQIAGALKVGADAGTVGRAAGIFVLGDQKFHFKHFAIAAPLLGVNGSGDIAFNGALDLKAVAAPLGDWKKALQDTKIPLVGDIGAQLVGAIQKFVNSATGKALYQFRITGTAGKPQLKTEPVPILTEGAAKLFAYMLKGGDKLLDQLKSLDGP